MSDKNRTRIFAHVKQDRFVIDDCELATVFTGSADVSAVTTSTNHREGSKSVSFAKSGTTQTYGQISRVFSADQELNLVEYVDGKLRFWINLSSLTDIASVQLIIGEDSTNNFVYQIADTDLTTGWNRVSFDIDTPTSMGGTGAAWSSINYEAIKVNFDATANTLTAILVDCVSVLYELQSQTFIEGQISGSGLATSAKQDTGNSSLSSIDGKISAATAAADAEVNTTAMGSLGARMRVFNGTTWDRIRSGITAAGALVAGVLNTIGLIQYNATPPSPADTNVLAKQADSRGNLKVAINDGANQVGVETVGADAVSNTANALIVKARLKSFNGATWDRIRSGITAVSATLTGMMNMLPWAIFHTTPSARTDGQGGPLEADANGNLKTTMATTLSAEDQTNNVFRVEGQFSGTQCTADTQVKASAGFLHALIIQSTDAVPTAGSIIVYDNTAESGTQVVNIDVKATASLGAEGVKTIIVDRIMTTGIYVGFTTVNDVAVQAIWR